MSRDERFTFICNKDERRIIAELAKRLQRSQSDTVRFVVINAACELASHSPIPSIPQQEAHQNNSTSICPPQAKLPSGTDGGGQGK